MMTSYDIHGPVVRPRREALWTWVDPLSFRENFRYEFEMEILDAVETESIALLKVSNKIMKTGSTYNDHYGFGTSREGAIKEAESFAEDFAGAAVDIVVLTTLKTQAVFFDDKKKPFYNGCVRCFHVPGSWRRKDDDAAMSKDEEFETWRNGAPGADAARLEEILAELRAADASGDRRNGPLR